MLDSSRHADAGNRAAGLLVDCLGSVVCSALVCAAAFLFSRRSPCPPPIGRRWAAQPAATPGRVRPLHLVPVTSLCTTSSPSRLGHLD
jgi:hypothetical protein